MAMLSLLTYNIRKTEVELPWFTWGKLLWKKRTKIFGIRKSRQLFSGFWDFCPKFKGFGIFSADFSEIFFLIFFRRTFSDIFCDI
jgi:hypothetical protein